MKFKLIRAGGFVGKSIVVEEDLANYPDSFLQYLEKKFTSYTKESVRPGKPPDTSRDKFQYFVEFKGKQLPLEDVQFGDEATHAGFASLLKKLMERLYP